MTPYTSLYAFFNTVQQEILEKIRQKRPSGSSSGIYFRQKSAVARLLFVRSVVALLCIASLHKHEDYVPTLVVLWKKN